jgi:GTP diphosphokinase / guanosine-3',5'-bis(diphosphate) 3'-diphosphatase
MVVRLNDILDTVSKYAPDADLDLIMRAYMYAARVHAGQKRKSGEPYLIHPIAVAGILAEVKMDVDTIATALLHDTIEDCLTTREELETLFSPTVAELVSGVTKIGKLQFRSKAEAQAENFRKMVLAMAQDVRVVIVKLADRLHNMSTLEHMKPSSQRRIAQETEEIYAPIANRLGLHRIKEQLQDYCLRYLHPEIYQELTDAVAASADQRADYIRRTTDLLADRLHNRDVACEVYGRAKSLPSIHRKMVEQRLEFDQVHDLLAFRVLVGDLQTCYAALGTLHGQFTPVPDKIKDYIAMPKVNGYQSLHTTVIGPEHQRIELQIRTHHMHQVAEHGIAAHWRYKEGHLDLDPQSIEPLEKLRELFEAANEVMDPDEFLATAKSGLFADSVYVFTPAMEVRSFPGGATVLDFAYAIHTDLGNTCTGAKVDGRMVSLRHELVSGERLEVVTKKTQTPSRDWLDIATTGRALAKIRKALRDNERDQGIEMGRNLLTSELKRQGRTIAKLAKEGRLKAVLKAHGFKESDQLYLALARGQVPLAKIVKELVPELEWTPHTEEKNGITAFLERIRGRAASPVRIAGESDMLVCYAGCCTPLPGEAVTGYITRGRGITVHLSSCPQLLSLEEERRVPVEWDRGAKAHHTGELRVVCANRMGLLANISGTCEKSGINITRAAADPIDQDQSEIRMEVSVRDVAELNKLIRNLEKIRGVISVGRVRK